MKDPTGFSVPVIAFHLLVFCFYELIKISTAIIVPVRIRSCHDIYHFLMNNHSVEKSGQLFPPPVHDEIVFFLFAIVHPSDITNPYYDDADDCHEGVIDNEPIAP